MNSLPIKQSLEQIAKDVIPTDIDLWARIEAQLPNIPVKQTGFKRHFASMVVGLAILALLILGAISPQGQALADTLFRFFTPAQDQTISIPTGDQYPSFQTVQTLQEAETLIGRPAPVFPQPPEGLKLGHIEVDFDNLVIRIHYSAESGGGEVVITQGPIGFPNDGQWESVDFDAIESVTLSQDTSGEYVQGGFVAQHPGDSQAVWNASIPIQRLRWEDGAYWFEIMKAGDTQSIEYLDKDGLLSLAEDLK